MKKSPTKISPVYLGIVFVVLDVVLFQVDMMYQCYINSQFCSEDQMATYIIHWPTSALIGDLASLFEIISGKSASGYDEYFLLVAGLIQSFILGYLIGWVIRKFKK